MIPDETTKINTAITNRSLPQIYYENCGHQDKRHIRKLLQRELDINVKMEGGLCESCIYGKAHRLPLDTRGAATRPGKLMSADVYSSFEKWYFIREKSELKTVLVHRNVHAKT